VLRFREMTLDELEQLVRSGSVYAIIDACDSPAVLPKMHELGESRAVSLFTGTPKEEYWAVAPYLAQVDDILLHWLHEILWAEPWGIFIFAKASLNELQHHFRDLLIVRMPDGGYWFFRYYDPRVLPKYLPTCSAEELKSVYGPVRAYGFSRQEKTTPCLLIVLD